MIKDEANILLEIHLQELGLTFVREFAFALPRKWRFDYLLCSKGSKAAIEIEGAVWTQGRHTRGAGYLGDMEKYREAAALGYKVYRFSTEEVLKGVARTFIEKHCKGEEAQMTEQLLYERALEYWMKRAKTAEAIIAAHCPRQEAQWISVEEKLPEMDSTWYLTIRDVPKADAYQFPAAGEHVSETQTVQTVMDMIRAQSQGAWFNKRKGFKTGVTHWMPLPSAPGVEAGLSDTKEK